MKPDWVIELEKEPCECVRCADCGGSGTVYYDIDGDYLGAHGFDDMDSPEPCDMCSNGVVEVCDRCQALNDYEYEEQNA